MVLKFKDETPDMNCSVVCEAESTMVVKEVGTGYIYLVNKEKLNVDQDNERVSGKSDTDTTGAE